MRTTTARMLITLRDGGMVDVSRLLRETRVTDTMHDFAGSFEAAILVRPPRNVAEVDSRVEIQFINSVTLEIERSFYGLIDEVKTRAESDSAVVTISGRSYAAIVLEKSVSLAHRMYSKGLAEIAEELCHPLGVKVAFPPMKQSSGEIHLRNVTVFEALKHIAHHTGLVMRIEPDGETIRFSQSFAREITGEPTYTVRREYVYGALTKGEHRPPECSLDDWK